MKEKLSIACLFVLVIISLNFFDAKFINPKMINYLEFLAVIGTVLISAMFMFDRKGGFVLPVQMISLAITFSLVMALFPGGKGLRIVYLKLHSTCYGRCFFYCFI